MDLEGLLKSVIRFSNFMTARLIVSGAVFYVLSGFIDIGSTSEGFLPNLDLINNVVANYQNIFDILGVSDFALLLIFFLFITAIHLTYLAFERVGDYIPPAIVPLPSWAAIQDLTNAAFEILREARGEEHSDGENQRLFEFRRKLEAIDSANEAESKDRLATTYAAFSVSKSLTVLAGVTWLYAIIFRTYTGDPIFLLAIFALAALTGLITTLSIFRQHHARIAELRTEVTHQLLGFAAIWLPNEYQQRVVEACVPSPDLTAARFKVLMPVYGTLDAFIADINRLRRKSRRPSSGEIVG